MEANFVVNVTELNADFIDGIGKVFPKDAVLNIKVSYDSNTDGGAAAGAPKVATKSTEVKTKRAYKKRSSNTQKEQTPDQPKERKKPGPKPKVKPQSNY